MEADAVPIHENKFEVASSLPLPICLLDRCDIDRWSSADLDLLFNSLKEHGPESVVTLHNQLQGGWQTEEDVQACYLAVLLKRIRPMLNRRRFCAQSLQLSRIIPTKKVLPRALLVAHNLTTSGGWDHSCDCARAAQVAFSETPKTEIGQVYGVLAGRVWDSARHAGAVGNIREFFRDGGLSEDEETRIFERVLQDFRQPAPSPGQQLVSSVTATATSADLHLIMRPATPEIAALVSRTAVTALNNVDAVDGGIRTKALRTHSVANAVALRRAPLGIVADSTFGRSKGVTLPGATFVLYRSHAPPVKALAPELLLDDLASGSDTLELLYSLTRESGSGATTVSPLVSAPDAVVGQDEAALRSLLSCAFSDPSTRTRSGAEEAVTRQEGSVVAQGDSKPLESKNGAQTPVAMQQGTSKGTRADPMEGADANTENKMASTATRSDMQGPVAGKQQKSWKGGSSASSAGHVLEVDSGSASECVLGGSEMKRKRAESLSSGNCGSESTLPTGASLQPLRRKVCTTTVESVTNASPGPSLYSTAPSIASDSQNQLEQTQMQRPVDPTAHGQLSLEGSQPENKAGVRVRKVARKQLRLPLPERGPEPERGPVPAVSGAAREQKHAAQATELDHNITGGVHVPLHVTRGLGGKGSPPDSSLLSYHGANRYQLGSRVLYNRGARRPGESWCCTRISDYDAATGEYTLQFEANAFSPLRIFLPSDDARVFFRDRYETRASPGESCREVCSILQDSGMGRLAPGDLAAANRALEKVSMDEPLPPGELLSLPGNVAWQRGERGESEKDKTRTALGRGEEKEICEEDDEDRKMGVRLLLGQLLAERGPEGRDRPWQVYFRKGDEIFQGECFRTEFEAAMDYDSEIVRSVGLKEAKKLSLLNFEAVWDVPDMIEIEEGQAAGAVKGAGWALERSDSDERRAEQLLREEVRTRHRSGARGGGAQGGSAAQNVGEHTLMLESIDRAWEQRRPSSARLREGGAQTPAIDTLEELVGRRVAKKFVGHGKDPHYGTVTRVNRLNMRPFEVRFDDGLVKEWDQSTLRRYLVSSRHCTRGISLEHDEFDSELRDSAIPRKAKQDASGMYVWEDRVVCRQPWHEMAVPVQLDKYSVFGEVAITVDSADISNKSRRKKQLEAQEMMTQARQDICDKDDQWKGQLAKGVAFKVEVFDTGTARGWGVRALQDIPENKAVMEYVGELVSRTDIKQREDRYLHEVEGTYVFDLPLKRGSRPSWVVDATRVGNAARFINHGCGSTANLEPTGFVAHAGWPERTSTIVPLRVAPSSRARGAGAAPTPQHCHACSLERTSQGRDFLLGQAQVKLTGELGAMVRRKWQIALVSKRAICKGEELLYSYTHDVEDEDRSNRVTCCCGDSNCKRVVF